MGLRTRPRERCRGRCRRRGAGHRPDRLRKGAAATRPRRRAERGLCEVSDPRFRPARAQALLELALCAPVVIFLALAAVAAVQFASARAGLDAATQAAADAAARAPDPAAANESAQSRFESIVAGYP